MSAAVPNRTPTAYERLCALPEGMTGEIIGGELHTQPRPSGKHAQAQTGLNVDLGGPFGFGRGGPGGWWILPEPELHFVRDTEVVVPDLAGWRRERMPDLPDDHRFEVVPDWVCEILSPGTVKKDRVLKLPLYARHGVGHVWLVDPIARTLEAFELREHAWMLIAALKDDDQVQLPPFEAVSFALSDLWAPDAIPPTG
ncbi:Uma2 family endonuclease [Methylolobus aquaticus]